MEKLIDDGIRIWLNDDRKRMQDNINMFPKILGAKFILGVFERLSRCQPGQGSEFFQWVMNDLQRT